jgi:hypothetical protein
VQKAGELKHRSFFLFLHIFDPFQRFLCRSWRLTLVVIPALRRLRKENPEIQGQAELHGKALSQHHSPKKEKYIILLNSNIKICYMPMTSQCLFLCLARHV